jgi:hypothetical protein
MQRLQYRQRETIQQQWGDWLEVPAIVEVGK